MKVAVAAELAPAKTFIPLMERFDANYIALSHGKGVEELLEPYCQRIYSIGESRRSNGNKAFIATRILSDIKKAVKALRESKPEILLTCGNAGDVRKSIVAAKLLRIPVLHIEQDIYNPIEMIAFADIITAPSKEYKEYLETNYHLKNVKNIEGYPHALYVKNLKLEDPRIVKKRYNLHEFILAVLGGDLKTQDIPPLIRKLETLQENILLAPFRFDKKYIEKNITSQKIHVLEGFVDLPSLMKASKAMIYAAGMGVTIEASVLGVPSIKIAGFHRQHASIDLCEKIGIPIAKIEDIDSIIHDLKPPKSDYLLSTAEKSVEKLIKLLESSQPRGPRGGFKSFKKIWKARSKFK
ncbi:MAG TPA: DUF354 domain-containing protein [Methanothermobacter sp.]|uniref:DUF354 domain-containing protein n=1 Tax=Methanothermobacter tenebrarum TaxID=680118 RepID=A0ABN6P953_9EURY|nr:DUF354 domain-containing protein [Methanothermobacter tenebrarum]MDD3454817.1 DUF354 domain-containing protein [Methanobacteriales archaeon]MDI6882593.1 DUF354 domain-containing protein [Methanothermobacter sp.]BDH78659.1 hypothetical protein MTTB_00380 [Methanothermobacter tenebrarum]HHW16335.1 DUF354 domain-containing protein [Methanothermobacter sp.]HOQ19855.1 DUF354 domain-containing protein [Methanothermobacter sp.]